MFEFNRVTNCLVQRGRPGSKKTVQNIRLPITLQIKKIHSVKTCFVRSSFFFPGHCFYYSIVVLFLAGNARQLF